MLDGRGEPIPDALIEFWQADSEGRYGAEGFSGFGRQGTGTDPERPLRVRYDQAGRGGGRGAVRHDRGVDAGTVEPCLTRLYFSDEETANAADPVLATVPEERRRTLIASRETNNGRVQYRFDIHMQGDAETVFFDL